MSKAKKLAAEAAKVVSIKLNADDKSMMDCMENDINTSNNELAKSKQMVEFHRDRANQLAGKIIGLQESLKMICKRFIEKYGVDKNKNYIYNKAKGTLEEKK